MFVEYASTKKVWIWTILEENNWQNKGNVNFVIIKSKARVYGKWKYKVFKPTYKQFERRK